MGDLEMHIVKFCDTASSMNLCLTEKKRKLFILFVEDQFMINQFKRIQSLVNKGSGKNESLENALDELQKIFAIAENFLKKTGRKTGGSLRRNLARQLEKKGPQVTGMRMKVCNEVLRAGMQAYGSLRESAEKCEEQDYSELVQMLIADIENTERLIKRDMIAWSNAKSVYYANL